MVWLMASTCTLKGFVWQTCLKTLITSIQLWRHLLKASSDRYENTQLDQTKATCCHFPDLYLTTLKLLLDPYLANKMLSLLRLDNSFHEALGDGMIE